MVALNTNACRQAIMVGKALDHTQVRAAQQ
jgi:hypothetical protein